MRTVAISGDATLAPVTASVVEIVVNRPLRVCAGLTATLSDKLRDQVGENRSPVKCERITEQTYRVHLGKSVTFNAEKHVLKLLTTGASDVSFVRRVSVIAD